MENTLEIGLITKPQGLNGAFRLYPLGDDSSRLLGLKRVVIEGKTHTVVEIKQGGGFMIVRLSGITDRNVAETLRGKYVSAYREDLPQLEEGQYYVVDLIGLSLYVGETLFGSILEVQSLKTDVITVKMENGKLARFPFLKKLNAKIDLENKTMQVEQKTFEEVICYED